MIANGRRPLLLAVCLLIGGAFLGAHALASEPLTQKEYRKRRSALRTAAGRYITQRKRFPDRCHVCKGSGKWRTRRGRSIVLVDCKQCLGKGTAVSKKAYREVYYEMRTPAFRALPNIKDELGRQYDLARRGQPWPAYIKRYRLHEWEMIDATHGLAWFKFNASRAATPVRFIYADSEGGGKPRWYLWSARSDGEWPTGRTTPVQGQPAQEVEAMSAAHGKLLRASVARSRITFRTVDTGMTGSTLRLTLEPGPDAGKRIPEVRLGIDAVRLARALFAGSSPWSRLEAVWHDHFRDEFGRIALRPRWLSAMDKAKHDAAAWDAMDLNAQIALMSISELTYEGWQPVQTQKKRAEPTPEPAKPEPSKPSPAEPTPVPATPPPTAPITDELPALTKRAEKEGQKGVEEIRGLLSSATEAFNAGQQARRDGAHDLWQEKLAEARTHLDAINAVWWEDIVPAMPGADEGIQNEVANEHFGEIWGDVDKLASIVRKVSAVK